MSRGLWFVAGAGAGVYAMVRGRRAAEALTPDGLRDRGAGLLAGARIFGEEVRTGMAERETELRGQLGMGLPALEPGAGPAALGRATTRSSRAPDPATLDPRPDQSGQSQTEQTPAPAGPPKDES